MHEHHAMKRSPAPKNLKADGHQFEAPVVFAHSNHIPVYHFIKRLNIKWDSAAVKLLNRIRDVLGSNMGRDIGYPN
jgi:hypothetical protein